MDASKLRKKLGELIRKKREAIGLSQEALAAEIGIHRNYIGSIERGERQFSVEILWKIAKGLNMKASTLLKKCEIL